MQPYSRSFLRMINRGRRRPYPKGPDNSGPELLRVGSGCCVRISALRLWTVQGLAKPWSRRAGLGIDDEVRLEEARTGRANGDGERLRRRMNEPRYLRMSRCWGHVAGLVVRCIASRKFFLGPAEQGCAGRPGLGP